MYGKVLGAFTSVARTAAIGSVLGAAVLPNTGSNMALRILSISTICLGIIIVISLVVTKYLTRQARQR